jgi:hypothetical protein
MSLDQFGRYARQRSGTRRSFDTDHSIWTIAGGPKPPGIPIPRQEAGGAVEGGHGVAVIVIDRVVAVPVERPEQIFLKAVRMPVLGNHLDVLLQRVGDPRDMRDGG